MTANGVKELYMWISTAWPLIVKPGVTEEWKIAKMRELYNTYSAYDDDEVIAAFQKWTNEYEKFPTTKNILNIIKFDRFEKVRGKHENIELWPMDVIYNDGNEWTFGSFKREDFINHPRNPEHLQPEEWERRFKIRRKAIMDKILEVRT